MAVEITETCDLCGQRLNARRSKVIDGKKICTRECYMLKQGSQWDNAPAWEPDPFFEIKSTLNT